MKDEALAKRVLMMGQKVWALQLEGFKEWIGLENLSLIDTPIMIEDLQDSDRFKEEASYLVEFGKLKDSQKSDIDWDDLLSEIELSES